jgi:16S rRNA (uracil1498-N3)-methyltransferase
MKNPIALSTLLKNGNQIVCARMNAKKSLSELSFDSTQNIVVVIGPEGDFSKSEIDLIDNSNVQCYHLGDRRLRAETAALNSLSILNEILN